MGAIRPITLILSFINTRHALLWLVQERAQKGKPNQGLTRPRLSGRGSATHTRADNCSRLAIVFAVARAWALSGGEYVREDLRRVRGLVEARLDR